MKISGTNIRYKIYEFMIKVKMRIKMEMEKVSIIMLIAMQSVCLQDKGDES